MVTLRNWDPHSIANSARRVQAALKESQAFCDRFSYIGSHIQVL